MDHAGLSQDCIPAACLRAVSTTLASGAEDMVGDVALANNRCAPFTLDVRFVLFPKGTQRAEHHAGHSLTERTERPVNNTLAHIRQKVYVLGSRFCIGDILRNLVQLFASFATKDALAAGFPLQIQKVLASQCPTGHLSVEYTAKLPGVEGMSICARDSPIPGSDRSWRA